MEWKKEIPEKDGWYLIAMHSEYKLGAELWTEEKVHEAFFHRGFWTWNDDCGEYRMKGSSDGTTTVFAWTEVPGVPEIERSPLGKGC